MILVLIMLVWHVLVFFLLVLVMFAHCLLPFHTTANANQVLPLQIRISSDFNFRVLLQLCADQVTVLHVDDD